VRSLDTGQAFATTNLLVAWKKLVDSSPLLPDSKARDFQDDQDLFYE
jgi:hypothetical protein